MDGSSEFDLAISKLRHVAHGNGVVLRIADAIETAHNGELKAYWSKEADRFKHEIDVLKMQYVIANRRCIDLERENVELRERLAVLDNRSESVHIGEATVTITPTLDWTGVARELRTIANTLTGDAE